MSDEMTIGGLRVVTDPVLPPGTLLLVRSADVELFEAPDGRTRYNVLRAAQVLGAIVGLPSAVVGPTGGDR